MAPKTKAPGNRRRVKDLHRSFSFGVRHVLGKMPNGWIVAVPLYFTQPLVGQRLRLSRLPVLSTIDSLRRCDALVVDNLATTGQSDALRHAPSPLSWPEADSSMTWTATTCQ